MEVLQKLTTFKDLAFYESFRTIKIPIYLKDQSL